MKIKGVVVSVVLSAALAMTACLTERPEVQLGPHDGLDLPAIDTGRVAVGDMAPDFSAMTYAGTVTTLSDYRDDKDVVLVFYRGHW